MSIEQTKTDHDQKKVLVVGAGAVGAYYGGRLAQAGLSVATLCRSHCQIIAEQGFSIESLDGSFHFMPDQVISTTDEYIGEADYILVAVKVLPNLDLPTLLKPIVHPKSAIILLQNGVEIEADIAETFPENTIISGLAFTCISRVAANQIQHTCFGRITLGKFPSGEAAEVIWLADRFKKAGVPCKVSTNIIKDRWLKLIWNAPFNPISVLAGGLTTREIMDSELLVAMTREIMEEVRTVAAAAGHPLPHEIIQRNLDGTNQMAPYKTSMLLDYEANRPMETEAMLGNALRVAQNHNLATPRLQLLYVLLKQIEEKKIKS